jgi:hypothetical protein
MRKGFWFVCEERERGRGKELFSVLWPPLFFFPLSLSIPSRTQTHP